MAPTVIVGDDENAGDVAARLLALADHQRDVKVRTDTRGPAFDVPDDVYDQYIGKGDRAEDEQRVNAISRQQDEQAGRDDLDGPLVADELPALAVNAEPMDNTEGYGEIEGDELPEAARVVEPPSNGDAPNDGSGFDPDDTDQGDGDQGDEPEVEDKPKPKPRKRTPRKSTPAPATPPAADAGTGE